MNKKYSETEYLFKNILSSKTNMKANYLDIPDNNCFYLCISEIIKNLSLNIDKVNNDYCVPLIKNFYNFLINDKILKSNFPAVYGTLISKLKDFLDSNKISKKELYGFLLDVKKRNALNYYNALFNEIEKILNSKEINDLNYVVGLYNTFINEIIARGIDIRFLNISLDELDNNKVFDSFINFVKYIGEIKPFNKDILDIYIPVDVANEKERFIEICEKRKQKYETIDNVIYCKIYDVNTNDYFTLIEDQKLRISSIFDILKLYSNNIPDFDQTKPIKIKSKILDKEFEIPFYYISKYTGNKPYAKHLYNTINSLDTAKDNDVLFYHKVLNTLSYAEKDLNYKNSSAFVDTWIALETLCSISEIKSGYEAVQFYVPRIIITKIIRQNITTFLRTSYKNYYKKITLEEYLPKITKDDYLEFLSKIPNTYNRYVLTQWAETLRTPKKLFQYICKLQDKLYIDILRVYILRNEYVHSSNINAFQTLEFYKIKNLFNNVIDEFFRCLTNRKDKDESRFGIGFDIYSQFNYKWEILQKSLRLMFEQDKYIYKSDTNKIISDNVNLQIGENEIIEYSDYLLNLLMNNNEILKKYVHRDKKEIGSEDFDDNFYEDLINEEY